MALQSPLADVKRLAKHWKTEFLWRDVEATLNELPNYRQSVKVNSFDPIDVHIVWKKSSNPNAIPLLFVHRWPGSFIEKNGGPAFYVVAPYMRNFGFSSRVTKSGFALSQYAETCHRLMQQQGYEKYVTQGRDCGFHITSILSILYPDYVLANYINMVRARLPSFASQPALALQHALTPYTEAEQKGIERLDWFIDQRQAYQTLHATKPHTISYTFADSPVALLAWIYEELVDWTDNYPWTDDEILTWISIYWFSTSGPNVHIRIYYEAQHNLTDKVLNSDRASQWRDRVKLGLAHFPKELSVMPKIWRRTMGPVVLESTNDKGGHFAAWEDQMPFSGTSRRCSARRGNVTRLCLAGMDIRDVDSSRV
ncbi:alpha/beta-hydrolase [Macroventuria anomochaeta]|uniref:Alpha/beta-hydrolase n=1 Tax=Macroventuria anomochaeta TaxID=301207 RepID=A0ACB6SD31_9PLEO|nr:alpha/beta-hydrolase [Macroventuria anomochaeta]KAF2631939.1 alpha/beta-hydrolase [Macroventuria anomochaeta]